MNIRRASELPAVPSGDGASVRELFTNAAPGIRNLGMADGTLGPGKIATLHYHRRCEEIYYIISGKGSVQVNDEVALINAGDAVYVPTNSWHGLTNTSTTEPLVVICISVPPFESSDFHTS